MKRLVLTLVIFYCINFACNAAGIKKLEFWNFDKPDFSMTQVLKYNLMCDTRTTPLEGESFFSVNAKEFMGKGGLSYNDSRFDAAVRLYYGPYFFDFISIGVFCKYHFLNFSEIFTENIFVPGSYIFVKFKNNIDFHFDTGVLIKNTSILAFNKDSYSFPEISVELGVGITYFPTKNLSLYLDLASYSFFDDALLGSPMLSSGFELKLFKNQYIGGGGFIKINDASVLLRSLCQIGFDARWGIKW